jgi:hypothetical protein
VVCVERTPSPLLVYSSRVVPGQVKDGNMCNRLPKDKSDLPAKLHLDKKQATVSRPLGSIDPPSGAIGHHLWPGPCQVVLDLIFRVFATFVRRFGLPS